MKKNKFKIILGSIILLFVISLVIFEFNTSYFKNLITKNTIENSESIKDEDINNNDNTNSNANIENQTNTEVKQDNIDTGNHNNNVNNPNTNNSTNSNNNNASTNVIEDSNSNNNDSNKTDIEETNSDLNEIKDNLNVKENIKLVDKSSGYCAQAIEYFYEDQNYKYYFTCIKSNSMYVIINNKEYKLVDALENKIVTIEELEQNGYKFLKKSKNVQTK